MDKDAKDGDKGDKGDGEPAEGQALTQDHAPPSGDANKYPKKRRKVNHACVYCRRSHMTCDLERPCTRCIKRNIGHLCHDEPREAEGKKAKSGQGASSVDDSEAQSVMDQSPTAMGPPSSFGDVRQGPKAGFGAAVLGQGNPLQLVQPTPVSAMPPTGLISSTNANQFAGFSDVWLTEQNHYHDMHSYNPNYMAPEVSNEFNLLNHFLHTSLLDTSVFDDTTLDEPQSSPTFDRSSSSQNDMLPGFPSKNNLPPTSGSAGPSPQRGGGSMLPPASNFDQGNAISRPSSVVPMDKDKAREYYLQAADPSGNDTPEQRMQRVLKAKYEAGLMRPFNYINGYARLSTYLDGHIAPASKQKILRTLDRFRPKFRESAQALTDMELLYVEIWFEKQLMEYDRVFASMAVPACCWRRTGEIFRGNKEMAELIHVPVERLRDGKIALHEILTEESVVRYWEEFGTIAFDPAHDTLLTAAALKNPSDESKDPIVNCCFSFMIRRDEHKMPTLIVGNFLPHDPHH